MNFDQKKTHVQAEVNVGGRVGTSANPINQANGVIGVNVQQRNTHTIDYITHLCGAVRLRDPSFVARFPPRVFPRFFHALQLYGLGTRNK